MINKYFQLEGKHIAPVQFIIEGHGDMATVTTIDPKKAVIRISIMPDFISDIDGLLEDLKKMYKIKAVDRCSE